MDVLDHDDLQRRAVRFDDALDDRRAQGIELVGRRVVVTEVKLAAILRDERQHEGPQPTQGRKCPVDEFAGFAAPYLQRLARDHLGRVARIVYPGMERFVLQILEALKDERRMSGVHPFDAFEDEPGFADACLARDQHGLSQTLRREKPAVIERRHFSRPADERGQALLTLVEPELHLARHVHLPDMGRFGKALEHVIAEVGEGEVALRQAIGRIVDADPARRRDGLDARGEMKGRADGKRLRNVVLAVDRADDHEAGGDPDANLNRDAAGKAATIERLDEGAPAGDRLLGVPAQGSRRPEIGGEPVARMMGEDAAAAFDDRLACLVEDG